MTNPGYATDKPAIQATQFACPNPLLYTNQVSPPPPPPPPQSFYTPLTNLSATGIPFSLETLTLLKWKDAEGNIHRFYLINKAAAKWRDFGIRFGQENELEGWEDDFRGKVRRCWCTVMSKWLDNDGTGEYPATWGGVVSVLEDVKLWKVARELERVLKSAIVHPPVQTSTTDAKPPATTPADLNAEPPTKLPELFAGNTIALSHLSWFSPPHPLLSLAPSPRRYFSMMPSLTHPILLNEFPSPQHLLLKLTSVSEQHAHSPSFNLSSPTPSPSPPPSP